MRVEEGLQGRYGSRSQGGQGTCGAVLLALPQALLQLSLLLG